MSFVYLFLLMFSDSKYFSPVGVIYYLTSQFLMHFPQGRIWVRELTFEAVLLISPKLSERSTCCNLIIAPPSFCRLIGESINCYCCNWSWFINPVLLLIDVAPLMLFPAYWISPYPRMIFREVAEFVVFERRFTYRRVAAEWQPPLKPSSLLLWLFSLFSSLLLLLLLFAIN